MSDESKSDTEFSLQRRGRRPTLFGELVGLLLAQRKWWLAPILLAVLLIGGLVLLGGSAAAPFIYTLF
jgi:hypothetical protein